MLFNIVTLLGNSTNSLRLETMTPYL